MGEILRTWRQAPLLLVTCPLVLGMIASSYSTISIAIGAVIGMASLLTKWKTKVIWLMVIFFYVGITMMHFRIQATSLNLSIDEAPAKSYIVLAVDQKSKSTALVARSLNNNLSYRFRISPPKLDVRPGDSLVLLKSKECLTSAQNPFEFDYNGWLRIQGIHCSVHLSTEDYRLRKSSHHSLASIADEGRGYLGKVVDEVIPNHSYSAMAKGILLGSQSDLSDDHATLFRESGVMHVMAVSGLHVGLIAFLLHVLTTISVLRHMRVLRFFIVITGIWSFVLITGMRPSGIRAALMFSVYFFGQLVSRKPSALNSIGLAVFIMLCIDPFQIWDIGFQLSVSAVFSIILFFPVLERQITTQNPFLKWVLQLMMMSMAVQFYLAPVSIYHFHQFPVNFLLSNLIAIPMASLVLCGTIISLVIYHISIELALGLGQIIFGVMSFGTTSLLKLNQYLGCMIVNLWPDVICILLYYVFAISIYLGFIRKLKLFRHVGHLSFISLLIYNSIYASNIREHTAIIAYGYPHLGVVDYFEKGRVLSVGQSRSTATPMLRSRMLGLNGQHRRLEHGHVWLKSNDGHEVAINPIPDSSLSYRQADVYIFCNPQIFSEALQDLPDSSKVITAFHLDNRSRHHISQQVDSQCIEWWDCHKNGHWMNVLKLK